MIDLKEAKYCEQIKNPDYNYEYSFEVVAPKRTWVLCPDGEQEMQEWMDDIRALISSAPAVPVAVPSRKAKRKSVVKSNGRTYESEESGVSDSTMLMKGWLEKRGEVNTAWKNRWFVLHADLARAHRARAA